MYTNIQHIFFDLDRTLWDFRTNSRETLSEIFTEFELESLGIRRVTDFIATYERINEQMWNAYRIGQLSKAKLRSGRFQKTLLLFGIKEEELGLRIGNYYVEHSPYKVGLFDHTHEVLSYLKPKYTLHIITNGFEEVQHIKLKQSGLLDYFSDIITSEKAGAKKPNPEIFKYAERITNASQSESIIIGDDVQADIMGGIEAGWSTIHFDPHREHDKIEKTRTINHLRELEDLL